MQVSTFKIGNDLFGVDILLIKEISLLQEVTPIPGAPSYNYGLMNLRGRVISIIHPMIFVKEVGQVLPLKNRILIFKTDEHLAPLITHNQISPIALGNDSLGLIVDNIGEVIEIDHKKDILPPTSNIPSKLMAVIQGVVQLEKEVILILNLQNLYHLICQNFQKVTEDQHVS